MTTPAPAAPAAAPVVPGKTLGIVALILAFLAPLIGVDPRLRRQGAVEDGRRTRTRPATVGSCSASSSRFCTSILLIVIPIIAGGAALAACNGLEPGVYDTGNGGTLTCG